MAYLLQMLCRFLTLFALSVTASSVTFAQGEIRKVVELFTSQGCYSCPPADAILSKIAKNNEDVLALEFHVDYWDTLVYGSAGQWRDPFSAAAYSKRQRDYDKLGLKGRTGVYTPQMVVDGSYAFVGSSNFEVKRQLRQESVFEIDMSVKLTDSGELSVEVVGDGKSGARIWLVRFDRKHTTMIEAGENMGKTLENTNVVRQFGSIGKWQGQAQVITAQIEPLTDNQGCAVLVQDFDDSKMVVAGPILGAAVCEPISS